MSILSCTLYNDFQEFSNDYDLNEDLNQKLT